MKLNNIPIQNKERDKAWEAFIKRKDVKAFMKENSDFKFPLDGSYEMWCIAWDKAWTAGFNAAQEPKEWVGLTDEEIKAPIQRAMQHFGFDPTQYSLGGMATIGFLGLVKEIEAKLKEKNT